MATAIASLRRRLTRDAVNLAHLDRVESLAADWMRKAAEPEINARLEMSANPATIADVAALGDFQKVGRGAGSEPDAAGGCGNVHGSHGDTSFVVAVRVFGRSKLPAPAQHL